MPVHCHNTNSCPFYQNWLDYRRNPDTRVVVTPDESGLSYHDCLTLIALDDPETGIPAGEELKDELSNPETMKKLNCPLNQLNKPNFLEDRLKGLLSLK